MFFLDLLFPNRCLECNHIIHQNEVVCAACFDQIYFTHHHFDQTNLLKERCQLLFPVESTVALMQFEDESLSRKIIHQLKYGGRPKVGKTLAQWVLEKTNLKELQPDLLVTVPLHRRKLRERGYNQLHLFADTLSEDLGIPCDHSLIKRNFYKKAQAKKNKAQRDKSKNPFSITKEIRGKHILVIDDVFTTGKTMSDVVWEILKNPENRVSVLVMAMD